MKTIWLCWYQYHIISHQRLPLLLSIILFDTPIHPLIHGLSACRCPMSPHFLTRWVSRLLGWLWYPELLPACWCPSPLLSPAISRCFSIHSLPAMHWISYVFLLYGRRICTHSVNPSLTRFLGESPGLVLSLVPDVVVPDAELRCTWGRNFDPNFCPGRGRTSDLGI